MTEGRSRKTRMMGLVLVWALVAVPGLYLLSVPPLFWCTATLDASFPGVLATGAPAGVEAYARGYMWLMTETPLRLPLEAYDFWWPDVLFPGHA